MNYDEVTKEEVNKDLLRYMDILSRNVDNTKTIMKGIEKQMANAVKNKNETQILECQQQISELVYNRMETLEGAKTMTYAIFSDIRNLDPNWWAVNTLIGNTVTNSVWGYSWSSDDQEAFITFINRVINDPKNKFKELAVLLRSSAENSKKYYDDFIDCIEETQEGMNPKMSKELIDTLVRKSCFPASEDELEILFDQLIEPKTW